MNQNDSELRRLYREGSRDEPGADLDSAILAAAHREVDAKPGRRVFRAWGFHSQPQLFWCCRRP